MQLCSFPFFNLFLSIFILVQLISAYNVCSIHTCFTCHLHTVLNDIYKTLLLIAPVNQLNLPFSSFHFAVQKELAFEAGYILCQQNVENYFRKIKELSKQSTDATKADCSNVQCKQKAYLVQKDLLKTLDQQWTEHVQNTNYNRKIDEQRLMQFDNQEKTTIEITSANDLNKQLTAQAEKASTSSDNQFNQFSHPADSVSSINPNSSINEKMNTLTLQSLNSSKHPLKSGGTSIPKKYYPTMWKDKPLSKADELMSIKLYNEIVMHNLNRNKSLCSSASSTSSCSSASSYAKTISSLNSNHHLTNHHSTNGQLARVMPVDLESNANLPSSDCSVNSSSSSQSPVIKTQSIMSKYSHSNSPFKKRKKIYQYAFDSSSSTSSDSLWRPW